MPTYRVWNPEDSDEEGGRLYKSNALSGYEEVASRHAELTWHANDCWKECEFAVRRVEFLGLITEDSQVVMVKVTAEPSIEFRTEVKQEAK